MNSEGAGKGSTIAGVVGLNEANLHEIEVRTSATTWREFSFLNIGDWVHLYFIILNCYCRGSPLPPKKLGQNAFSTGLVTNLASPVFPS